MNVISWTAAEHVSFQKQLNLGKGERQNEEDGRRKAQMTQVPGETPRRASWEHGTGCCCSGARRERRGISHVLVLNLARTVLQTVLLIKL